MAPITSEQFALQATLQLQQAGYAALWAGGCVRDRLLGKTPTDYDVATNAKPEEIRELFGRRRTLAIGAAFGVITVIGPKSAGNLDVVTFRSDDAYSDGRRPDSIRFSSAELDAQRRDFTINGLFYDPISQRVIDFVDGQADLEKRVVRAIGDPHERIAEDKLRMLRAVRFAANLGFRVDSATAAAVREHAQDIVVVSPERIAAELERMLTHSNRRVAVELLAESGLLPFIVPECEPLLEDSELLAQSLGILEQLPDACLSIALAALLYPIAPTAVALKGLGQRLKLSNQVTRNLIWVLAVQDKLRGASSLRWSEIQPLLVDSRASMGLTLGEAIAVARAEDSPGFEFCRTQLQRDPGDLNPAPLLTGDDLKSLGYQPGPLFSDILTQVRKAQLDGEISAVKQAVEMARKIAQTQATSD